MPTANHSDVPAHFPRVTVELFGVPHRLAGTPLVELDASTVGEALTRLAERCPALVGPVLASGRLLPAYRLNLNGDEFLIGDPDARGLREGDCLLVVALDAGG
jgi:hypothetical protein